MITLSSGGLVFSRRAPALYLDRTGRHRKTPITIDSFYFVGGGRGNTGPTYTDERGNVFHHKTLWDHIRSTIVFWLYRREFAAQEDRYNQLHHEEPTNE